LDADVVPAHTCLDHVVSVHDRIVVEHDACMSLGIRARRIRPDRRWLRIT
jgi:hypothetical protein